MLSTERVFKFIGNEYNVNQIEDDVIAETPIKTTQFSIIS